MLLGEQGLLTVAAIPIGFLMGYAICAALTMAMQTELYRMPLVIKANTYALSVLIISLASLGTAALIYRRLRYLDLVEVLKTRE
jgi:putative ABC transport system permease protein